MKNIKYIYILLCFGGFGVISFLPDFTGVDGRMVTIPYRFLILSMGAFLLLSFFFKKKYIFASKRIVLLLLIFISLYSYRLITDLYFTNLDFGRSSEEILLFAFAITFFPAFILSTMRNNSIIIKVINPLIILFTITSFLAVASGFMQGFSNRLAGNSILNAITLGHIAASGIILIVVAYFTFKKEKRISNWILLISLAILLLALLMAASRGPILSLLLVLIFILPSYLKFNAKNILMMTPIILILMIGSLQITESSSATLGDRLTVDMGGSHSDGEARVFLWSFGFKMFLDDPIIGSHATTIFGYPHNIFIEVLIATGIFGAVLFIGIVIYMMKRTIYLKKIRSPLVWVGLIFMQYFIGSIFSGTIYSNTYLWYSIGLLLTINYKQLRIH